MTTLALDRAAATGNTTVGATVHYALSTIRLTVRNWPYLIFTVGMPVVMYLLFDQLYGSAPVAPGVNASALIMIQMAAYGSLGAAMSGGAFLALERRSGWFRQLTITALPPRAFLIARGITMCVLVLPALVLVSLAGFVVGGVRAPAGSWVSSILLMWVALIPLALLGLVIGVWVKGEAVQGVSTLTMLVLSLAGGLWFPASMLPHTMQVIAKALPSYWIARFGEWPFLHGRFPWGGVAVLAAWSAVSVVFGALGYRRAAAASKR